MSKILVLCPTRSRPENAERLFKSIGPDADLVFLIDNDDPRLVDYLILGQNPEFYYYSESRKRLGPWLNKAVEYKFTEPYDIVGFLGDDVIPRTHDWAKKVSDAMVSNGIVYADDGLKGEELPTGVFMDARMVEKAGYMVYPELTHVYIDNHWKAWGEALGTLSYLPDVLLEHMHPYAGKAEHDAVYDEANSTAMYSADSQAYENFVHKELPGLVSRLG